MWKLVAGLVLLVGLTGVTRAQDKPAPMSADDLVTIIEHQRMNATIVLSYGKMTLATAPSMEQIRANAQAGYRGAKNQQEIASIEVYCRDLVAVHSFKARDKLNLQALALLRSGQIDPANVAIKQSIALSDLDRNLADLSCRPSS